MTTGVLSPRETKHAYSAQREVAKWLHTMWTFINLEYNDPGLKSTNIPMEHLDSVI